MTGSEEMMRSLLRAIGERELLLAAALVAAVAVFSVLSPYFMTASNLVTVLRNCNELFLIGLGMTLVLGIGGVDVSVGVVMGLAAIAVGRLLQADAGALAAGLAGPLAGGLIGLLTASVVVLGRIPAIVATLGLFGVYRAAVFLALGGAWLSGLPTDLTQVLGASVFGLPAALPVVVLAYLLVFVAIRYTPFGLYVLAAGNSEAKARLSGIAVRKVQFAAYVVSGLCCGLAATFYIATYRNVAMTVGGTLALEAIAAVIIGGTSILGGRMSLLGTAFGVLLLRILQNGLLLVGVPSLWQPVVTGLLLLAVLGTEAATGRLNLAAASRHLRLPSRSGAAA
ncbi:ABC transporter permease [Jiella sp. M17.18]|uniref:ABC transporter permease n=1 Tax=Jiella sp. M17.18 TaxID=3234247 RepID=UPI0034DE83E9